jgi:glycerophosphoryl diester phosphodiesterase
MKAPRLIAHRGYAARYPENSLPGIEAAILAGARHVEVDVQLSADRVPVLFHDADLERVCGVSGLVREWDFADLQALSAHEPGRFGQRFADNHVTGLAALAGLLARHPGVVAFIEAKSASVDHFGAAAVLDAIARALAPVAGHCVLISSSVSALAEARRRGGAGEVVAGWHALGGVVSRWSKSRHLAGLGLDYLFCNVRGLPGSGRLAFESARLAVYEIGDAAQALAVWERGVEFIETFDLPRLQAELRGQDRM